MSDMREVNEAFERAWSDLKMPSDAVRGAKRKALNNFMAGWQAARAQGGQGVEPVALLRREIGESSWFDHAPVRPNTKEAEWLKVSPILDYCEVFAHPQPAQQGSVPEGRRWRVPEEATEEMLEACMSERDRQYSANAKRYLQHVWQTMVNHLPDPPQPPQEDSDDE